MKRNITRNRTIVILEKDMPSPALEITQSTTNALRRIRRAASEGQIDNEEMHKLASETVSKFAKALLVATNRREVLKPEDRENAESHIEHLNNYIASLLPDVQSLYSYGNPITEEMVNLIVTVLRTPMMLKKFNAPEYEILTPLSRGAIMLSVLSYLHEIPLYFSAVNKQKTSAVISPIESDKRVEVLDDVLGDQAKVTVDQLQAKGKASNAQKIW